MEKMKFTAFEKQLWLGLGVMILCFFLAEKLEAGFIHNIGWIFYGLLFLIHPVWPLSWDYKDYGKLRLGCRSAGVLAIVIGLITRFGV